MIWRFFPSSSCFHLSVMNLWEFLDFALWLLSIQNVVHLLEVVCAGSRMFFRGTLKRPFFILAMASVNRESRNKKSIWKLKNAHVLNFYPPESCFRILIPNSSFRIVNHYIKRWNISRWKFRFYKVAQKTLLNSKLKQK